MGLECFVCSELDSIPCPDSNSDYNSWKADTQKYVSHDPATSTDGLSCGIIIGGKTLNIKTYYALKSAEMKKECFIVMRQIEKRSLTLQ